jgi:hypothetical protein
LEVEAISVDYQIFLAELGFAGETLNGGRVPAVLAEDKFPTF